MKDGLETRQWRLKDYLDQNRGRFITIEEICNALPTFYKLNTNPYTHDKCATLSSDVRTINWNGVDGYEIIIKDSKGSIKYAETEKEFEAWRKKELDKVEKKSQYLNNLKFKASLDGVVPVINKANNPVDLDKLKEISVFKGGR